MKSIGVFCGAEMPKNKEIIRFADELGVQIAERGIKLVYGGAKAGLMGVVSKSCHDSGGQVLGIIPEFLAAREVAHLTIDKLFKVRSFQSRRVKFAKLSDAFLFLPGGLDTLRDFTEWVQLKRAGIIHHPLAFLNIGGFYDPIQQFYKILEEQNFLNENIDDYVKSFEKIEDALDHLNETCCLEPVDEEFLEKI